MEASVQLSCSRSCHGCGSAVMSQELMAKVSVLMEEARAEPDQNKSNNFLLSGHGKRCRFSGLHPQLCRALFSSRSDSLANISRQNHECVHPGILPYR